MSASAGNRKYYSPPVELPSSNAQNFFEEARVTKTEEVELRRKFMRFCISSPVGPALDMKCFCRLLQYYEAVPAVQYEAYFYAMDRNRDDLLDFNEFFLGCCAADPSTVHILNSFTGYERSQYIFDFYDCNRSAALEFTEFARLAADTMSLSVSNPNDEQVRRQAIEKARDLGTLEENGCLLNFCCIKFKRFYEFIHTEQLRGTSRLFRFYKSIVKPRSKKSLEADAASIGGGGTLPETQLPSARQAEAWEHLLMHNDLFDGVTTGSESSDCEEAANVKTTEEVGGSGKGTALGKKAQNSTYASREELDPYTKALPGYDSTSQAVKFQAVDVVHAQKVAHAVVENLTGDWSCENLGDVPNRDLATKKFELLEPGVLEELLHAVVKIFEQEDSVICSPRVSALPTKIFGSLHGQLVDLLSFFKFYAAPLSDLNKGDLSYSQYVFLGDYVDRGATSLELLCLLFSLKLLHPTNILLLRGAHDNRHVNAHCGFRKECETRLGAAYGARVFDMVNNVFEHMPLAASLPSGFFLSPSGIVPSLVSMSQLKYLPKPLIVPSPEEVEAYQKTQGTMPSSSLSAMAKDQINLVMELFYPAFYPEEKRRTAGAEDNSRLWDVEDNVLADAFCKRNEYSAVIRSRLIPTFGAHVSGVSTNNPSRDQSGQKTVRLLTICSCLDVGGLVENEAAMLHIVKDNVERGQRIRIRRLASEVPRNTSKIFLQARTSDAQEVTARTRESSEDRAFRRKHQRWPGQSKDLTPRRVLDKRVMNVTGECKDFMPSKRPGSSSGAAKHKKKDAMRYEIIFKEEGNVTRQDEVFPRLALDTIKSIKVESDKDGAIAADKNTHRRGNANVAADNRQSNNRLRAEGPHSLDGSTRPSNKGENRIPIAQDRRNVSKDPC